MKLISGLAAVALAATTLAPLTAPAAAATPAEAADFAGDWIAGELVDGVVIGDYGPDAGSGIDAALALEALGRDADAEEVADGLGPLLVSVNDPYKFGYVKASEYDYDVPIGEDPIYLREGYYANATAKAAAFVERLSGDAANRYSEIDLLDQLETLTDDVTGRISDDSSYPTDYANSIGQAFAVEALAVAGSSEASAATDTLLARQCEAGFFPLGLDGACPASELHPDVTALALISLVRSGLTTPEVAAAIDGAADWLESVQLTDGSFPGDGGATGANTNGTGLAGWALGLAGRQDAASKAAAWVRSLQVADAGACASKAPNGAIAFNATDYDNARLEGVGPKRTTWRFATFQAAPALLWAPTAPASLGVRTPATAADGATVTATVEGLATGEHGCVALGSKAVSVTGTGDPVTVDFQLPAGPGAYTFTVATVTGTQTSTTTVAGASPTPPTAAPTTAPTTSPAPVVGELKVSKVERVKRNRLRLAVACEGAAPCEGKVVVRTKRKVETPGGAVRKVVVAREAYSVEAGEKEVVVLKVRTAARPALKAGRLRVIAVHRAAATKTVRTAFWLKRAS